MRSPKSLISIIFRKINLPIPSKRINFGGGIQAVATPRSLSTETKTIHEILTFNINHNHNSVHYLC